MKKRLLPFVFIGILFVGVFSLSQVCAAPVLWDKESGGNDHWYDLIRFNGTWDEANNAASSQTYNGMSGHLVTITSQEENDFIYDNVLPYESRGAFIGAYQYDETGGPGDYWAWVTGEEWDYTNWYPGAPNDWGGPENRGEIFYFWGNWNDVPDDAELEAYVIEYEPPGQNPVPVPCTILLMGSGLLGLAGLGRKRLTKKS